MFKEVKKNFGFGCMRLPMIDGEVDKKQFNEMIDVFIENGFNYFDTAHVYIGGKSETALKECLAARYPRDKYILADKLTSSNFTKEDELEDLLKLKLDACGVDYFDFYLMHAQNAKNFVKYKECKAYEFAFRKKEEGLVKHVGISFHDTAEVLEQILIEYPQIEFVQIQFNYVDYEDPSVQSRKCYEVCRKYNKPIIVMEPVRGGSLVNLPLVAKNVFNKLNNGSVASYAIRYAASFEGIFMVLSGMSNMEQMIDNISYMKDFKPLNEEEYKAIDKVCQIYKSQSIIKCTACQYCVPGCPKSIPIPDLFACYNDKQINNNWNSSHYYGVHTNDKGKASDCIGCGKCEIICPQKLNIRELLVKVKEVFE